MNLFDVSAILITACAFAGFINQKWFRLPSSIGVMLMAMFLGLIVILFSKTHLINDAFIQNFLANINFQETIFHGMLSFLLFAGALQINLEHLKKATLPVAVTATISTFLSTLFIGLAFYYLANSFGFHSVTLLYAMLFGAILSPTDPIAVLSIIRKMRASKKIETTILGESLFNDGVAIVFFLCILELIQFGSTSPSIVVGYFIQQVIGGISFGILLGVLVYRLLLETKGYPIKLMMTLAVATGGYSLAEKLHFSAPLSMVIAGIILGNQGRSNAMSEESRKYLDAFWESIDEILNAILFFLIGLEMLTVHLTLSLTLLGLACIVIALFSRFISLAIPFSLFKRFFSFPKGTLLILTWGGLRGALSIAMVLSLQTELKALFLPCVYFVVIFSIAVQGLSFTKLLKHFNLQTA